MSIFERFINLFKEDKQKKLNEIVNKERQFSIIANSKSFEKEMIEISSLKREEEPRVIIFDKNLAKFTNNSSFKVLTYTKYSENVVEAFKKLEKTYSDLTKSFISLFLTAFVIALIYFNLGLIIENSLKLFYRISEPYMYLKDLNQDNPERNFLLVEDNYFFKNLDLINSSKIDLEKVYLLFQNDQENLKGDYYLKIPLEVFIKLRFELEKKNILSLSSLGKLNLKIRNKVGTEIDLKQCDPRTIEQGLLVIPTSLDRQELTNYIINLNRVTETVFNNQNHYLNLFQDNNPEGLVTLVECKTHPNGYLLENLSLIKKQKGKGLFIEEYPDLKKIIERIESNSSSLRYSIDQIIEASVRKSLGNFMNDSYGSKDTFINRCVLLFFIFTIIKRFNLLPFNLFTNFILFYKLFVLIQELKMIGFLDKYRQFLNNFIVNKLNYNNPDYHFLALLKLTYNPFFEPEKEIGLFFLQQSNQVIWLKDEESFKEFLPVLRHDPLSYTIQPVSFFISWKELVRYYNPLLIICPELIQNLDKNERIKNMLNQLEKISQNEKMFFRNNSREGSTVSSVNLGSIPFCCKIGYLLNSLQITKEKDKKRVFKKNYIDLRKELSPEEKEIFYDQIIQSHRNLIKMNRQTFLNLASINGKGINFNDQLELALEDEELGQKELVKINESFTHNLDCKDFKIYCRRITPEGYLFPHVSRISFQEFFVEEGVLKSKTVKKGNILLNPDLNKSLEEKAEEYYCSSFFKEELEKIKESLVRKGLIFPEEATHRIQYLLKWKIKDNSEMVYLNAESLMSYLVSFLSFRLGLELVSGKLLVGSLKVVNNSIKINKTNNFNYPALLEVLQKSSFNNEDLIKVITATELKKEGLEQNFLVTESSENLSVINKIIKIK